MVRTLQISFIILYALIIAGLMSFIVVKNGENFVPSADVKIFRETKNGFLNKDELLLLLKNYQNIDSIKINQLKIGKLEHALLKNPYVKNADVYTDIDGSLIINVSERTPIVRIFNKTTAGYYLANDGDLLPLSNNYSARVLMVNGYFNVPYEDGHSNIFDSIYIKSPLEGILNLAKAIDKSNFLKAQINQVYVNSKFEFELIPEFGNQIIQLGDLTNIDNKLKNLEAFYQQALLEEGLEKYIIINLKFDGQVVCTKK